jgi:hypothetical protein
MAVNEASRATMTSIGLRYVRTFHADWDQPIPGASTARSSTRSLGNNGLHPLRKAFDAMRR